MFVKCNTNISQGIVVLVLVTVAVIVVVVEGRQTDKQKSRQIKVQTDRVQIVGVQTGGKEKGNK